MLAPSSTQLKRVVVSQHHHSVSTRVAPAVELEKPHVRLVELGLGVSALLAASPGPKARSRCLRASRAPRAQLVSLRAEGTGSDDPLLAEAKAAAEAAKLQLEANKLPQTCHT